MSECQALLQHPTKATPLPIKQLTLLYLVSISGPLCFFIIFPFINQMILDIGAVKDSRDVGYYAGIVEASYSFTQLFTVYGWVVLADRIGRKPVLLMGCVGSCVLGIMFAFSRNLTTLLIIRSLLGAANGNMSVARTAITESCDETNSARAFSFLPVCVTLSTIVASILGGSLTNIGLPIPSIQQYPYLLPMAASAIIPFVTGIIAVFCLKETRQLSESSEATAEASIWQIFTKGVSLIMFTFFILSFIGVALSALLPLFCFTPISQGGLGMSPRQIGLTMSVRSITVIAGQLVLFPPLQRRLGTIRLSKWLMTLWIPSFLALPIAQIFARNSNMVGVNIAMTMFLVICAVASMSNVCNLLLINASAPSPELLGSVNGFAQMISSMVGFIGPTSSTALFAFSISTKFVGGNLIWLVSVAFAFLALISSLFVT